MNKLIFVLLLGVDQLIILGLVNFFPNLVISRERYFSFASPLVFWVVTFAILLTVWRLFSKKNYRSLTFITVGALSNFITFKTYGHFIDYIPTGLSYINTADLMIGVGCIVFVWNIFISEKQLQTSR